MTKVLKISSKITAEIASKMDLCLVTSLASTKVLKTAWRCLVT